MSQKVIALTRNVLPRKSGGAVIRLNTAKRNSVPRKLNKRHGLEKWVMVLIACVIGIGIGYLFRSNLYTFVSTTFTSLNSQAQSLITSKSSSN